MLRPRPLAVILLATSLLALVGAAPTLAAVPTVVGERLDGCGGGRGAGERDAAGNLYFACQNDTKIGRASIRVYDANGAYVRSIATPAINGNAYFNDVVPSPDAKYLYVSSQSHNFHRLSKQGDTYVHDTGFRFEDFPYGAAKKTPMGEFMSVDGAGNVYLANGTWVADALLAPMTVVKYGPDGKFLSRFGDWGNERKLGELYWMLTDIAVTRDGVNLYTTEVGNNRVQRWEQQFNTHNYVAKQIYGNTAADDVPDDPNQAGDQSRRTICDVPGKFGAPYGSALDAQGHLYVVQTNCYAGNTMQVQRLGDNGVWTILKGPKFSDAQAHSLAIDAKGNIYSPSVNAMLRITGQTTDPNPPQPPADATAPQLTAATLPANVPARNVTIALTATDNLAVTQVRVANENQQIADRPWLPYAPQLTHELTAGDGAKTVSVQVRDAAGNLSNVLAIRTTLTTPVVEPPAQQNTAPVLRAVTIPATTTTSTIDVVVDATDDHGVTDLRFATEDGNWQAWRPFAATTPFALTPGVGARGVFVQVRDAQGLTSASLYKITQVTAAPAQPPAVDATAPIIRAATLPATVQTRDVTIQFDATDAVGITQVRLANETEDINHVAWKAYAASITHQLTAGNGAKTVSIQVRDAAGNVSAITRATTTLAAPLPPVGPAPTNTAPTLRQVTVPATTTVQFVDVVIDAADDKAVTQARFATEDGNWRTWQPYAATTRIQLSAGIGYKGVYIQVRDAEGLESTILYRTLQYVGGGAPPVEPPVPAVNQAPTLTAVTVPNPATTQTIRLSITATDDVKVTEVRFATEDGNWGAWRAYDPAAQFTLSAGVGPKGVFVQVRDAQKAESTVLYRTTQLVAPANPNPGVPPVTPPVVTPPAIDTAPIVQAISLPATTPSQLVTVRITASDDRGIAHMRLANEDGNWKAWRAYSPTVQWNLSANRSVKGVFVQVRDTAGHESNIVFRTTLCAPCSAPPKTLAARAKVAKAALRPQRGGMRADRVRANVRGQDFDFSQRDGKRDIIDCGKGFDTILKQPEDITRNCERVVVVKSPRN